MTTAATGSMTAASLIVRFAAEWRAATHHPFLTAVATGTLPEPAFNEWLAQDYLFVADLFTFQARLLARARRPSQAALASGVVGLEAELGWFEAHAAERGVDLEAAGAPTTERYRLLLVELDAEPYPVAILGLWAIERAYLDAWRGALPGGSAYREFVEHWTHPEFAEYVMRLEQAANLALGSASAGEVTRAAKVFVEVARLEADFWDMAWSVKAS